MAKFELNYKQSQDYDDKVDLEIRLKVRPTQEDYKTMLDAIELLDKIAKVYCTITTPPVVKKGSVK